MEIKDIEQEQEVPEKLADLVDEYFEHSLALNPLLATRINDDRWNDILPNDISPEYRARVETLEREYLGLIQEIDTAKLKPADLLTWEIFKYQLETSIESFKYPSHLIPLDQLYSLPNFFAMLGSGGNIQPFKTIKNYEDFLGRMKGFRIWVDQAIRNMKAGIKQGYTTPKIIIQRVLPQLQAHIVEDETKSLFYRPIVNFPASINATGRKRLKKLYKLAIKDTIVPAYKRLYDFLQNEYITQARETAGLNGLPNGEEWYRYYVRIATTTNLSPSEIHQIGLDEVTRILKEMENVLSAVNYDGTLHEFIQYLKTNPVFFYKDTDELVNGYRGIKKRVHSKIPDFFLRFPKADYEIRPVEPFREKSAPTASYIPASMDGSRPGIFYVNTYDLDSRPKWMMESVFMHEAVPGHHFQIALQQEIDELPRFRRFGYFTAYIEGWGLYAESLGTELGMYTDPYQYFGYLANELWRAVRLVVDTGLHAKNWTREQVQNYMRRNTALSETEIEVETERYIAIPGQALAYKIGQLKIRELRIHVEKELGKSFDIRAFHEEILRDGSLPLDILKKKLDHEIKPIQ